MIFRKIWLSLKSILLHRRRLQRPRNIWKLNRNWIRLRNQDPRFFFRPKDLDSLLNPLSWSGHKMGTDPDQIIKPKRVRWFCLVIWLMDMILISSWGGIEKYLFWVLKNNFPQFNNALHLNCTLYSYTVWSTNSRACSMYK